MPGTDQFTSMKYCWMLLAVVCLLLGGCGRQTIKTAKIKGVYAYRSGGISEVVEVQDNGHFQQTITMGTNVYHVSGIWTQDARDVKFRGLFLARFDTTSKRVLNPPEKYFIISAYWDEKQDRLSLGIDDGGKSYYLDKSGNP